MAIFFRAVSVTRFAGQSALTVCVAAMMLFFLPGSSHADEHLWSKLRSGKAFALMRHALAPGTSDPAGFDISDCSTQRNLDDRGRAQARSIGEAFRKNGIEQAIVLSSEWCRCLETAQLLGLGEVQTFSPLNSFFEDRSTSDQQTREVRQYLMTLSQETPRVLVTHQVNITALTGQFATSGEMIVVKVGDQDDVEVLGEIAIPW